MKRRFEINDDGMLVDRHGYVLGRITSITLESVGDIGGPVFSSLNEGSKEEQPIRDGGSRGETPARLDNEIREVWRHYCELMQPRDTVLHPAERKLIRDALKVATVDECKTAITGNARSTFHQGQNNRHRRYNKLSHILKAKQGQRTLRENIDFFIDLALEHESPSALTSEGKVKIDRLKDRVRRGIKVEESVVELREKYGIESRQSGEGLNARWDFEAVR